MNERVNRRDPMENKGNRGWNWCWTSAAIGAAAASAVAAVLTCKPRDPVFQLTSIKLAAFKLHLTALDTDLVLGVHVGNPNVVPIEYSATAMSIFYEGSLLGSARVEPGLQGSNSCRILRLLARLEGKRLAPHVKKFVGDVARRQMEFDAAVDIEGRARVLWWGHPFKIRVDSRVVVDPVLLDVIDQENKAKLKVSIV